MPGLAQKILPFAKGKIGLQQHPSIPNHLPSHLILQGGESSGNEFSMRYEMDKRGLALPHCPVPWLLISLPTIQLNQHFICTYAPFPTNQPACLFISSSQWQLQLRSKKEENAIYFMPRDALSLVFRCTPFLFCYSPVYPPPPPLRFKRTIVIYLFTTPSPFRSEGSVKKKSIYK
ncbi:hypothetical protein CDAR_59011 [Caerostris darwini]|uniref:Uncharacterized protein n=1 Tax=Caerostris darwini TaxID=1538125 RepID=A0AAV4X3P4_9ARAC|nr:hypothetical protein CDAR_59011 [Caerostris darwini]